MDFKGLFDSLREYMSSDHEWLMRTGARILGYMCLAMALVLTLHLFGLL